MRIGILARRLYPLGGAERSIRYLQRRLAEDHTTQLFGYQTKPGKVGSSISTKQMPNPQNRLRYREPNRIERHIQLATGLKQFLDAFSPDVVIAQHEPVLLAAWYQLRRDVPIMLFVRDKCHMPDREDLGEFPANVANRVAATSLETAYQRVFRQADVVIANSNFMASEYKKYYSINLEVVYPFIPVEEYRVCSHGEKILHVNPSKHKGIETTLDIAERLTDEEFLIVGQEPISSIESRIRSLPNVNYEGYIDNMTEVYERTKLVLYPSQWAEPFGRVPIEAGVSGIPTVCSGTGGLPEAVGHRDFIVDSGKASDYIHKIMDIKNKYSYYSDKISDFAVKRDAASQYEHFMTIAKDNGINLKKSIPG